MSILDSIAKAFDEGRTDQACADLSEQFLDALESGAIRCAEKNENEWCVDPRVKKGILLCFRLGQKEELSCGPMSFVDKGNLFPRHFGLKDSLRIVPFSSSARRGSFLGKNVVMMPPSYINIGAFVDEDSMIDSHALVGSCAQVGKRVHLSAGVQIGGVLEPIGASPVVIEDDCLVGGNCGIYEGTQVQSRAVIGAGVILTKSVKVFDLVHERILQADGEEETLKIPANAVVVPGMRNLQNAFAKEHGLSVSAPIIIKYRDEKTDTKIKLEDLLR